MPTRKYKLSHKRTVSLKKKLRNNKTHKHSKSKNLLTKSKLHKNVKKNKHYRYRGHRGHRGGFGGDCNLATVKESGFSLDSLGSISGLSIPETRAAVYRPNCKSNSYHAMI